jgi:hypothetical protein
MWQRGGQVPSQPDAPEPVSAVHGLRQERKGISKVNRFRVTQPARASQGQGQFGAGVAHPTIWWWTLCGLGWQFRTLSSEENMQMKRESRLMILCSFLLSSPGLFELQSLRVRLRRGPDGSSRSPQ